MSLSAGVKVGPYDIVELLGRGGMGEVYRGRDAKLRRDVAIKILPSSLASDPDRLRRFEREAQVLASFNHPHIAAIHGFEEGPVFSALILELVEGPTLAERIAGSAGPEDSTLHTVGKGRSSGRPIPLDETLDIAQQVCDGLDAAHERGVIHRDPKPSNIKLTPDGVVKLLDFGLAKAACGDVADLTHSPTMMAVTVDGVLMGTAPYMSPERAPGRQANGHLVVRLRALRDADWSTSFSRRDDLGHDRRDPPARSRLVRAPRSNTGWRSTRDPTLSRKRHQAARS